MNTITLHDDRTPEQLRHERAFRLVDPGAHAAELAERGLISPDDAKGHSWRDEICALVTDLDLEAAGVTIDDVKQAIAFFTATEATVSRETIGGLSWVKFLKGEPGYMVRAVGYRSGPAGP